MAEATSVGAHSLGECGEREGGSEVDGGEAETGPWPSVAPQRAAELPPPPGSLSAFPGPCCLSTHKLHFFHLCPVCFLL